MSSRTLLIAVLLASVGGAVDCIDEDYDPLQPGRHDFRTPKWGRGMDVPGAEHRRAIGAWHEAGAAPTEHRRDWTPPPSADRTPRSIA